MSTSIMEHFAPLPDFRVERSKLYRLPEILLMVVCAVLRGTEGWEAIDEFGKVKFDWLRKFAPIVHGIPSHDCIAHVVSRLRPKACQVCFLSWTRAVAEATSGELVAVDGTSLA